MDHFKPIKLQHSIRLLNHGPTVLITSQDPESHQPNVMAAAWSMPVEFEPPRIAIVVDKSAWSRDLIARSAMFAICIPTISIVDLTYAVGSVSGREENKFTRFNIPYIQGPALGLPVIEQGCAGWMECRLLPEAGASEKYDTLFGEVVSAAADERVFSMGHWSFDDSNLDLRTLHHLGGGNFVTNGPRVKASDI